MICNIRSISGISTPKHRQTSRNAAKWLGNIGAMVGLGGLPFNRERMELFFRGHNSQSPNPYAMAEPRRPFKRTVKIHGCRVLTHGQSAVGERMSLFRAVCALYSCIEVAH